MPAYLKLGDLEGDADQADHAKWIACKTVTHPITRSIRSGAKGIERSQGSTMVGDVKIVKYYDKASTKLAEACAGGKFFKDATIDMCSVTNGKVVKNHTFKLTNVVVTSYIYNGSEEANPPAFEEITLNFTKVQWIHTIVDKATGEKKGEVPGEHDQEHK